MKPRTRTWIIAANTVITILCLVADLLLWNTIHQTYAFPPALTEDQMASCYAMRNEEKIGNYTFVNCPEGAYWDLGKGKKRWCVRRNG